MMSKSMPKEKDMSNMLANGVIFSTFKHIDPGTVRGGFTLTDGVVNERLFRKRVVPRTQKSKRIK